ncbi:MAG: serine/threonine-protein phosphatase, partial [Oscillospiraceae bacterium]|nr:serine/threonine-protein phosphatase [Oscillospiraceae bacterium]
DDDHLVMVMADVSGKGIPAALFMMASKILINNYASMGLAPHEILERTNETICKNNQLKMFVTVWIGILEISTGKVTASNAGHEYPAFRQPDGKFELFKDKHGFVIGGMKSAKYKQYEFTMQKGSTLFIYTDGVPEATNSHEELFGTERMIQVLNQHPDVKPQQLLTAVHQTVNAFVGDAPQFDDLTMLAITLL